MKTNQSDGKTEENKEKLDAANWFVEMKGLFVVTKVKSEKCMTSGSSRRSRAIQLSDWRVHRDEGRRAGATDSHVSAHHWPIFQGL